MRSSSRSNQTLSNDNNRWLVSYADFITLLFAFFVVLYAISSINLDKYKNIAKTLDESFRPSKLNAKSYLVPILPTTGEPPADEGLQIVTDKVEKLDDDLVKIVTAKDWVEIQIRNHALFENGQADLGPEAIALLGKVAKILNQGHYYVSIEGHTDNKPIQTNRFQSNWELSAARAAAVARILQDNQLQAKQISAIGYADQFPIATNDSDQGRSINRRVSIVISKKQHAKRMLNPSQH